MTEPEPISARDAQRSRRRGVAGDVLVWVVAAAFAVPLVSMVLVSMRPSVGVSNLPGKLYGPTDSTSIAQSLARAARSAWTNYREVWTNPIADFPLYLHNSVIVAALSVIGSIVCSTLAAYGFSRLRWAGRDAVFTLVLLTLIVPQAVLIAPQFVVLKKLGLVGTLAPLWLPSALGTGFGIFLLRQFFLTIPRELDEAARLDGCSHWGVLWRVMVPQSLPALATVAIFQFIASWNDFLTPLVFVSHQDQFTLALGLHAYQGQQTSTPWNLVMAASVMAVLPVLVVYLIGRRFFVGGASGGGTVG